MAETLLASRQELQSADMLLPVPLHKSKYHQRGFNQAEEIARCAQKVLGRTGWHLSVKSILRRVRPTTSQTGLSRHQRRANVRGAFQVVDAEGVAGKNVILVDDVLTTGTTAQECARILRKGGAARVWVATAARVSKQEPALISTIQQEGRTPVALGTAAGE